MLHQIRDHEALLFWLTAASAAMFVGSLIMVPLLVARIPADYFAHAARPPGRWTGRRPAVRLLVHVLKNVLGLILIAAGIAMLVLPGQGLLTIVLGLLTLDFPGKYRFERWLVSRARVRKSIDWLRQRSGCEPMRLDAGSTGERLPAER
jgi:hypothetical protein